MTGHLQLPALRGKAARLICAAMRLLMLALIPTSLSAAETPADIRLYFKNNTDMDLAVCAAYYNTQQRAEQGRVAPGETVLLRPDGYADAAGKYGGWLPGDRLIVRFAPVDANGKASKSGVGFFDLRLGREVSAWVGRDQPITETEKRGAKNPGRPKFSCSSFRTPGFFDGKYGAADGRKLVVQPGERYWVSGPGDSNQKYSWRGSWPDSPIHVIQDGGVEDKSLVESPENGDVALVTFNRSVPDPDVVTFFKRQTPFKYAMHSPHWAIGSSVFDITNRWGRDPFWKPRVAQAHRQLKQQFLDGGIDDTSFLSRLTAMADVGYTDAQYDLGRALSALGRLGDACKRYLPAANAGLASAQFEVAQCYQEANGLGMDRAKSLQWLRKAAATGHAESQYLMAILLLDGDIQPESPDELYRWMQASADRGTAEMQYYLGICHASGGACRQDNVEAVRWLYLAQAVTLLKLKLSPAEMEVHLQATQALNTLRSKMPQADYDEGIRRGAQWLDARERQNAEAPS